MSQKASRKSAVNEEKEKNTDTPVKEMKKKMAANAEKEKQAAEKLAEKPSEKHDKKEKAAEKPDKSDKSDKPAEKPEKSTEKVDKSAEKNDKVDKKAEKSDKKEKQPEKKADPPVEKKEDKEPKDDKSKPEKPEPKKSDTKPKQNGSSLNGSTHPDENGTVSPDDDSDELADEMFPELAYDDASDPEFEPPDATGRSYTRRSQAKSARTPETPRPASDKTTDAADDQSKVLKLKEDAPTASDRKLRSSDSPKPQDKKSQDKEKPQEKEKEQAKNALESQKVQETKDGKQESVKDQEEKENGDKTEKIEVDVVIEIEGDDEPRKTDTNYSKSRVKVSPYRRSLRADHTATSMLANYTGNNTTMEMDITESSFVSHEEGSLDDSSYLSGLRSIRGRRSYKPLKEMTLRHVTANRSANKSAANVSVERGAVIGCTTSNWWLSFVLRIRGANEFAATNVSGESITESSSFVSHEEGSLDDSSYLSGLRSIRGRRSYKPLKEMTLRHVTANRSANKSAANVSGEYLQTSDSRHSTDGAGPCITVARWCAPTKPASRYQSFSP
ncbi:myb-like protein X [Ostrinia nubilalis]|uniref:myb-like protein X n=1 Tax=Ostrinia nubilalis TaxID=29057 RepID=UPI0030824CAB